MSRNLARKAFIYFSTGKLVVTNSNQSALSCVGWDFSFGWLVPALDYPTLSLQNHKPAEIDEEVVAFFFSDAWLPIASDE